MSTLNHAISRLLKLGFSTQGRVAATHYTATVVLGYALFYAAHVADFNLWGWLSVAALSPLWLVLHIALLCITIKRLHDIDLPGGPAALVLVPVILSLVAWGARGPAPFRVPGPPDGWDLAQTIVYAAVFLLVVALSFIPGTRGDNRHGPDPGQRGDPQDVF